jgi:hypothetical protein
MISIAFDGNVGTVVISAVSNSLLRSYVDAYELLKSY